MKKLYFAVFLLSGCFLTSCGKKEESSAEKEMQYIKTSQFYETVTDMYNNPDKYLDGTYHFVGELYSMTDDNGNTYYSVYGTNPSDKDCGIGIEMRWDDFSGLEAGDEITVEGTLSTEKENVDGLERTFLILTPTLLEKHE